MVSICEIGGISLVKMGSQVLRFHAVELIFSSWDQRRKEKWVGLAVYKSLLMGIK